MAPRILLADDDRHFADILAKALSAAGYEMSVCYDGERAVSMAREQSPELVILDVLLPQRDGFSALQAIRADTEIERQPAALLLTGCSPTARYRTRAHELAAEALLTKPLPLDEIQARVAKAIGSGPPVQAGGRGPSLHGELEKTPLPAVLHQLHGMRASGVLVLENGDEKRGIELSDGQLSSVQSNLRSECLGNLLAAAGKISWDVMHESLRRVKQGEGLQGQILLAMHMLDEEDLARALRQQADEKLFQAFAWARGSYQFASGAALKTKNRLRLKRSVANAIMQGVRSRTPFSVIERFFSESGPGYLIPSERPFYRFQEIDLATDEEQLFAELADGLVIPEGLPRDEALLRALYGFIATELVEFRRGVPPAAAPKQTAAEVVQPTKRGASERRGRGPQLSERSAFEATLRADLARLAKEFHGADAFGVLGVPERTNDAEVRAAYIELAKRTHPDRLNAVGAPVRALAEDVFARVSEAYEALSTAEGRQEVIRARRERPRDEADLDEGRRALEAELAFQKGDAALSHSQFEKAEEYFRSASESYPEEGEYLAHWALASYLAAPDEAGRLQESIEMALQARRLSPQREKIYLVLGKLYKAADRAPLAERMFGRAVELDPDCLEAVRELRLLDMRRGRKRFGKGPGILRRFWRGAS